MDDLQRPGGIQEETADDQARPGGTERVVFSYTCVRDRRTTGGGPSTVRAQEHTIELEGPPGDHILEQIRRTGTFYEGDLLRSLDRTLREREPLDLVVDVGANLGNHAVFFSKVLGASVICVEPCPLTLPYLTANLERNGLAATTEVVPAAAARKAGHRFVNDPSFASLGTVHTDRFPKGDRSLQVPALPIDKIVLRSPLASGRRVGLIKIDVEGAEEEVLSGADWILRNHTPIVVVELSSERAFERVTALLTSKGHSVAGPYGHTPVYVFTKDRLGDNLPLLRRLSDQLARTQKQLALIDSERESKERLEKELESAQSTIAELRRNLREIQDSARYRIGDVLLRSARPSLDLLRLPWRLLEIYRDAKRRHGAGNEAVKAVTISQRQVRDRHRRFEHDAEKFLHHVRRVGSDHFVVMYGGTTYIQDVRANRPIRLTRALLELAVPVLFNFHRWRDTEHIPRYDTPLLLQSPIDLTPGLVRRLLGTDLGEARRIFIVSYPHPSVLPLINLANVNGWVTFYDCRDDWEEFHRVGAAKWYRESVERFVVNNCDLSFCVSRPLQQKMSSFAGGREVRLSPNAYDPAFLVRGYEHRPSAEVKVGYFGHLTDRWFDWDALRWIAENRPALRFEIIGHGEPADLSLPRNVALLGPKRHGEICRLASEWSAGIIPFRMNRLADGVDPIKIYEYFGLGLPVVSFRMPQIAGYPYTQTVESRAEFLLALDRAVTTRCDPDGFQSFLERNTWEGRARQILAWADEVADDPDVSKSFYPVSAAGRGDRVR